MLHPRNLKIAGMPALLAAFLIVVATSIVAISTWTAFDATAIA